MSLSINAQDNTDTLPYYQIPDVPKTYTAGSTVSRMLDGLGFRYYWATEGLRTEDLKFKPNKEARTTEQTIQHIYDLVVVVLNSVTGASNSGQETPKMTFQEMRKKTLQNIEKASKILLESEDISQYKIVFKRGGNTSEFPFWNQINGPISDALWHVGQVVSFRRSSGNPLPKGVSVFRGVKSGGQ